MADITTMQDLLELQQELKDRLVKKLEPTALGKSAIFKGLAADKGVDIKCATAALDNAVKEREAIVKYWDDRVARLRGRVETLTKELKQEEKQAKTVMNEAAKAKKTPAKKTAAKKRPTRDG